VSSGLPSGATGAGASVATVGGGAPSSSGPGAGGYPPGCDVELPGPPMVTIERHGFCIDATEVTNAQYEVFLSQAPDPPGQGEGCADNESFEPVEAWPVPAERLDHPASWIDWCDADAYCRWAGKRLCGGLDGAPLEPHGYGEWMEVCTGGGKWPYPYGPTYDPTACHTEAGIDGQTAAVGTPTCEGGYPGVFDMVGNVFEWQDNCNNPTVGGSCPLYGASFQDGALSSCDQHFGAGRYLSGSIIGFRCCRDAN